MAKNKAPTELTGGEGFNYEDCVAARFLVDMLSGLFPFGPDFGRIVRIDWQARDTGRILDDLVITLNTGDGLLHTAELSVKSHRQIKETGFPSNFVEACWEEWLNVESEAFQNDRDLLVLVTGCVANGVMEAWQKNLRESLKTSPNRMLARLTPPSSKDDRSLSSEMQRRLFQSLDCPEGLKCKGESDSTTTVKLLKRIRVLHCDFQSEPSRAAIEAIADGRNILQSGDADEATDLWGHLVRFAATNRGTGGSVDLAGLLSELRGTFALKDHPDYRADLEVLERWTHDLFDDIRTDIAGIASLPRSKEVQDVDDALTESRCCLIVGESGCGKSAIAKIVRGGIAGGRGVVELSDEITAIDRTVAEEGEPVAAGTSTRIIGGFRSVANNAPSSRHCPRAG